MRYADERCHKKKGPGLSPEAFPARSSAGLVATAAAATVATAAAAVATAATAAAAAAAAAATVATTTAAAAAAAAVLRLVDPEAAATEVATIERLDGGIRVRAFSHLDEGESSRPTGFPVRDDAHLVHCTVSLEELTDFVLGGSERQVSDIKLLAQSIILVAPSHAAGGRDTRRNQGRTIRTIDRARNTLHRRQTGLKPAADEQERHSSRNGDTQEG
jgi:hypothetical protein